MLEADESYGTFRPCAPEMAVVTNVEPDHLDHYGTFDALQRGLRRVPRRRHRGAVVGADDPVAAELGPPPRGRSTVGHGRGGHLRG